MDIYKHRATTNNHGLYLYLLRMCDFRTVKFGLVVVFLFFFACGGLVGPRVTVTWRSRTALSCIILASMSVDGPFDKIINYTRNVIIRTHGDYFSQTKAASGLNRSIGCVEILYGL